MNTEAHRTPIQNFYAGQSIFITGGIGFLGKVLIEKLLRSCFDITTIYLLIRSKKDKCPESRLDEIFQKPLFEQLKKEVSNFRKKIVPITGDLESEDFGLSTNDKKILINEVSIIFHLAANIRFDQNIKISMKINTNAGITILKFAKHMPNLKSFIHVSTMYANYHVDYIEERFYSYRINHKELIMLTRNLSENEFEKKISRIVSKWPNIYIFTKAIMEQFLKTESGNLPIGIFRPAVISPSASEPLVGWIDNYYGSISFVTSVLCGLTRFLGFNGDFNANLVPVDFTANALITSAWDVFNQCRTGKDMLIYNFGSPIDGPTWKEFFYGLLDINKIYPLHNIIYFPFLFFFRSKILYRIYVWLGHFLPALLMDAANICMGRSPRMWKLIIKRDKDFEMYESLIIKDWNYSTDNVQAMWDHLSEKDQQLFNFNMMGFDWTKYFMDYHNGIRHYLLNEDDSTLEISRIKYKRFYWIHQIIKAILIFIVLWTMWFMFRRMFA